jgi:hypothetical protein
MRSTFHRFGVSGRSLPLRYFRVFRYAPDGLRSCSAPESTNLSIYRGNAQLRSTAFNSAFLNSTQRTGLIAILVGLSLSVGSVLSLMANDGSLDANDVTPSTSKRNADKVANNTDAIKEEQGDAPEKETPKSKKKQLEPIEEAAPQYWAHRRMEMRFGMSFFSEDNYCTKLYATVPFPRDWDEQSVKLLESELPNQAQYSIRDLPAGATQVLINVSSLGPQQQLDVILNVEIEKAFIKAPKDPALLKYPKKGLKEKSMQWYLNDSPMIDTRSKQIREIAMELRPKDGEELTPWQHVERLYDWVRETIRYRTGPLRSTKDALKDKQGDCEEMSGLFVALCRASNIPARCVWIPEHCYAEFYLEDENGFGHWFPAQVAGDRQFGEMNDYRPILQKGDRFKVPELPEMQRYVAEHFTCKRRSSVPNGAEPRIVSVRDLGELIPELDALKASTEPKAATAAGETPQAENTEPAEETTDEENQP